MGKGSQRLNYGNNRRYLMGASDIIDIKKEAEGRQLGDANDTTTV